VAGSSKQPLGIPVIVSGGKKQWRQLEAAAQSKEWWQFKVKSKVTWTIVEVAWKSQEQQGPTKQA
jgi:hypothetical protein